MAEKSIRQIIYVSVRNKTQSNTYLAIGLICVISRGFVPLSSLSATTKLPAITHWIALFSAPSYFRMRIGRPERLERIVCPIHHAGDHTVHYALIL